MTRTAVYITSLSAFIIATSLTFTSIYTPNWLTWDVTTRGGTHVTKTIGLQRSCSSVTGLCQSFSQDNECTGDDRYFCTMWRSAGFLVSLAAVLDLVTLIAFAMTILGGREKRQSGWPVLCGLLFLVAGAQCAPMAIVAYLFDHDHRFFIGWKLDTGFILCTISWSMAALSGGLLALSALVFPPEGGYELLPTD